MAYVNGTAITLMNIMGSSAQSYFENYHFDNTRNRIMAVVYQDVYDANLNNYDNASFYNYDVHGNVEELLQVNNDADLVALNQAVKKLRYTYDLVSGNVNEVIYQKDQADEFRHKYHYDDDNRITNVFTSDDGVIYEQDAKYFYYDHGPLARTEIGDQKVQAMDYAYTVQGWIKSVNGEEINRTTMMGQDGNSAISTNINKHLAQDAFGYSLSYFEDDYKSANESFLNHSHGASPNLPADHFNGNIGSMFTALTDENETPVGTHQTKYTYDQLNRIKSMTGFNRVVAQAASTSGYSSSYSFDENGNLETLKRNAWNGSSSVLMDDFKYHYNDTINGGNNNRLSGLTDQAGASQFSGKDIDNSITASNYVYDQIGQLIRDIDEGILEIKWKVTNKVEEIVFDDGKVINFDYDAMGNRIAKHVTEGGETVSTYYFLDAQSLSRLTKEVGSNQMGMYMLKNEEYFGNSEKVLELNLRY